MRKLLVLILFSFFLFSCATKPVVKQTKGEIEKVSLKKFKKRYNQAMTSFDYLKVKGKVTSKNSKGSKTASVRLYIEKNSRIWANIGLFGITGARANITPNKVQAYEVLEKQYLDSDFDYFNKKFNVSFIDFDKLKHLLTGRLFLINDWSSYDLEILENQYAIHSKENESLIINPKSGTYVHSFYLDADYRLKKVEIKDILNSTEIEVSYYNWIEVNNKAMPSDVKVVIKGEKEQLVELNYNNFSVQQDNPPFRIPSGYSQIEL